MRPAFSIKPQCNPSPDMARPAGFEPATYGLEVRCSIRLSYERVREAARRL